MENFEEEEFLNPNNGLTLLFRDTVIEQSLKLLINPKFKLDYILEDSIDSETKIKDLDELIEWAIEREMYEECTKLKHLKEDIQLLTNIEIDTLI
jgi:hypothetical protein